jgi:hypothetical protein
VSHNKPLRYFGALGALFAAAALILSAGVAAAADHSGTVMAVDRDRGTIVIGELGPWHVKDGSTEVTKRTIAVSPTTQFVASRRTKEPGPTGWRGEFVDVPLDPWTLKEGDFITVRVEKDGKRPAATKITVTVTEGG